MIPQASPERSVVGGHVWRFGSSAAHAWGASAIAKPPVTDIGTVGGVGPLVRAAVANRIRSSRVEFREPAAPQIGTTGKGDGAPASNVTVNGSGYPLPPSPGPTATATTFS